MALPAGPAVAPTGQSDTNIENHHKSIHEHLRTIHLRVNGISHNVTVEPCDSLARVLRDRLGLTGTKVNCDRGECGACTVLLDGRAVNSCLVLAVSAEGHEIVTIEGLEAVGSLDPLQQAYLDHDASHCGFCTPGMIMAAKGLLMETPNPRVEEIQEGLAGNLCRCTGYKPIINAVRHVGASIVCHGDPADDGLRSCCRKDSSKP